MQCACAMLSTVSRLAMLCFSTLCHKRHIFVRGGGVLLNVKCILIFSTTFVLNNSYSKKNKGRCYHNCAKVSM